VKTTILVICGVIYGLSGLLMMGAILLQESKGGGLAALGGTRAESAFGASNPLRRLTTVLAILFFVLASVLSLALPGSGKSVTDQPTSEGSGMSEGEEPAPGTEEKKPVVEEVVPIPEGEPKDAPKEDADDAEDADAEEEGLPAPKKPEGAGEAGNAGPAAEPDAGKPKGD
jgi:protein translocase SecG subunit